MMGGLEPPLEAHLTLYIDESQKGMDMPLCFLRALYAGVVY